MNIHSGYGHKVIAKHLDWGWDSDKEIAQKYLEQDKEYTVDLTIVYGSSTDVFLVEIPDVPFNSVHFVDVTKRKLEAVHSKLVYIYDCSKCEKENLVSTPNETLHCSYCGEANHFEDDDLLVDF